MNDPTTTRPGAIVGIDLGTTNSLIAVADERGPRVIADEGGRVMVPSVVRYSVDAGGRAVVESVGDEAKRRAADAPERTVSSVKRIMGRSIKDAAGDLPFLPYRVVEGANRTARVEVPGVSGGPPAVVSPQEVSAAILREMKARAERALGRPVTRAVVTVPAYFDDAQRQATRDAGRLAGLEVVRIVNEPTAAALAYGLGLRAGGGATTIAVYDLGGGTFDVSVLRVTHAADAGGTDFFRVLATAGDTHLGGDDLDRALAAVFEREIAALPGVDAAAAASPAFRAALAREAERVKIELSESESASARVEAPGAGVYRRAVTRAEFETLIEPLIARTLACCERAVRDASLTAPVDAVVMVGGCTRVPLVRRRVGESFGVTPYTAIDPDRAVALGAAVQGAILSGGVKGTLLLDVIPLSLGIETAGGAVAKIIPRNAMVPARAREMFSTQADGQTAIKLHVLQGEREMVEDCRSLGVFHLRGLPPMPAGIPQVEVEFLVDANGVLNVSAHERRSGKRASLQVVPNHGLSRDEVDRIERDSYLHARDDMTRHRVVDLTVNSRLDLKWVGERLAKHRDRLDPADASCLDRGIAGLRSMVDAASADWRAVDPDAFHAAKESLDRAAVRLMEVSIAASLREDPPSPAG
ncbi:MAG: Fe-S protein assembly chaperone HscA [Phycisphaeraceae bacterium]|nr:MAG: Fe-S protein assembly chaperone HscA [Phycisphaeraceae bacterium]